MVLQQVIPPGIPTAAEEAYTGLNLGALAPPDRPHVICNFVATADGRATAQGRTALLGGPADREVFHLLRTQADAVLAGTGTLRVERYGRLAKNERFAGIRVAEDRPAQPLGVIISRSGEIPFEIPLFADEQSRVAVYAPAATGVPDCAAEVTLHPIAGNDELPRVMQSLRAEHGVRVLLCEGGPALFNAMLAAGVVDELFLTLAPALVGGGELGVTTGAALAQLIPLRLVWALEHDGNLFLRYSRADG